MGIINNQRECTFFRRFVMNSPFLLYVLDLNKHLVIIVRKFDEETT